MPKNICKEVSGNKILAQIITLRAMNRTNGVGEIYFGGRRNGLYPAPFTSLLLASICTRSIKQWQLSRQMTDSMEEITIDEKPKNLTQAFELLTSLPDDFYLEDREDLPPQERDF